MILASRPHYRDHLVAVAALTTVDVALVASYGDLVHARLLHKPRIVLMQHGIGQSYSDRNPAYPGGRDNDDVGLFLTPNAYSADRFGSAYPHARVEVIGSPRLDDLPRREPGPPTIAVTFHWRSGLVPEARHAFDQYRDAIVSLSRTYNVIGHGHPRATWLPRFYRKHGIEHVPSFDDVCRRADLLIFDNTSAGYDFAATGRPVVVLNSRDYRRDVRHGLRFWDAAGVGVNIWDPHALPEAVEEALADAPERKADREAALDIVFAYRTGAAQRAADVIEEWVA